MNARVVGDLASAAADEIAAALADGGSLVLAGGRTPAPVYRRLAAMPLDWSAVHIFFGDERCVPPDDPDSNYRMACEALLDAVGAPFACVHRIQGELGADPAAQRYEQDIRRVLGDDPVFDLVLLGLGADGHTASLFPGSPTLDESVQLVAPARAPQPPVNRVTLTLPAFARARRILFLVSGTAKAATLRRIAHGEALPAARVRPLAGEPEWLLDREAAAGLG